MIKKNKSKSVMYSSVEVERTLDNHFLTPKLRSVRKRELEILEKQLFVLHDFFREPLRIFDIGVGDGYVPISFSKKLLDNIESYIGIDNSLYEVEYCKKNIKEANLDKKIKVIKFDAVNLGKHSFQCKFPLPFHAILCTYFTSGNFRPKEIKLEWDSSDRIIPYPAQALEPNREFQKVFSDAYRLICKEGKLILGSVYTKSESTRLEQEEFYKKCGMHIITTKNDEFTATKEGFWSERFNNEKLYYYLDWVSKNNIKIIPLDADNFACMVIVTKK